MTMASYEFFEGTPEVITKKTTVVGMKLIERQSAVYVHALQLPEYIL